MALFRKKDKTTTTIPELQEYYANQQKESTGKAWLFAVGSLLVTIVILVGAFYGGRWAYRKITNDDKPTVATTQKQTQNAGSTLDDTDNKTSNNTSATAGSTPQTSTPSSTTTPTTNKPATTTPAQGVATTQSAATNQAATSASTTVTRVPDTGSKETITLAVFVLVASYALHALYLRRTLNK